MENIYFKERVTFRTFTVGYARSPMAYVYPDCINKYRLISLVCCMHTFPVTATLALNPACVVLLRELDIVNFSSRTEQKMVR